MSTYLYELIEDTIQYEDNIIETIDLYNALCILNELDRFIIDMIYINGETEAEVAYKLNRTIVFIRGRKRKIMKKLRLYLNKGIYNELSKHESHYSVNIRI